ncbi:hypothetical protein F4780DRAFT_793761 [Xylariomycetidae sp. FL0641]|nr:hypothetical protein F4780DRAFT_793761 [Xylariomycetidae sp. FL0641]
MYFTSALLLASGALAAPRFSASSPLLAPRTCSIISGVKMTFYGSPDNDPAGSTAIAYDCGRGYNAGGTGTFSDPLTFATSSDEYGVCSIVYSPYLKKYLRMEDDCVQCDEDWESGIKHIDIWTGNAHSGGDAQIQCENSLTPDAGQDVVTSPDSGYAVDSAALWDGSCHTDHIYSGNSGSSYCGNGGGSSPGSGGCQTGCSWEGHCIGCSCATYNDCSDDYICSNGVCASS